MGEIISGPVLRWWNAQQERRRKITLTAPFESLINPGATNWCACDVCTLSSTRSEFNFAKIPLPSCTSRTPFFSTPLERFWCDRQAGEEPQVKGHLAHKQEDVRQKAWGRAGSVLPQSYGLYRALDYLSLGVGLALLQSIPLQSPLNPRFCFSPFCCQYTPVYRKAKAPSLDQTYDDDSLLRPSVQPWAVYRDTNWRALLDSIFHIYDPLQSTEMRRCVCSFENWS